MKQILTLEAFEAFNYSIFDKAVFCLGEKQGMLTNDDFLMSVRDRRKEILYGNGLVDEVVQNNPTPECKVNGTKYYESECE